MSADTPEPNGPPEVLHGPTPHDIARDLKLVLEAPTAGQAAIALMHRWEGEGAATFHQPYCHVMATVLAHLLDRVRQAHAAAVWKDTPDAPGHWWALQPGRTAAVLVAVERNNRSDGPWTIWQIADDSAWQMDAYRGWKWQPVRDPIGASASFPIP